MCPAVACDWLFSNGNGCSRLFCPAIKMRLEFTVYTRCGPQDCDIERESESESESESERARERERERER